MIALWDEPPECACLRRRRKGAAGGFAPAFELGDAGLGNASDDAVRPDLLELEVVFQ